MGLKEFFKERLGLTSKEIDIRPPAETEEDIEEEVVDERATRRRLFESKMLRIVSLVVGLEIAGVAADLGVEAPVKIEEQSELRQKLGPRFDEFLEQMRTYDVKKESVSENLSTEVGNFEGVDASNEEIKNFLYKGFPDGWLSHTSGVGFVPYELDLPEAYGLKPSAEEGVPHMVAYVEKRGEIGGANMIFSKKLENFFDTVSHELGHANDWLGRVDLSKEERIRLLYNVVLRVQSPDRFKSSYVESISNKDQHTELQLKATEYWAEIIQVYFDYPAEAAKRLPADDYRLIEQYLKKVAPHFDMAQAAKERETRERVIKQEVVEKKITECLTEQKLSEVSKMVDNIKMSAGSSNRTATYGPISLVEQVEGDLEKLPEQEVILNEAFSHGDKKWAKVTTTFLDIINAKSVLAGFYKDGNLDACTHDMVKSYVEMYAYNVKSLEKQMKKFSPAEQKKINAFHNYLENVLTTADILPETVVIDNYL